MGVREEVKGLESWGKVRSELSPAVAGACRKATAYSTKKRAKDSCKGRGKRKRGVGESVWEGSEWGGLGSLLCSQPSLPLTATESTTGLDMNSTSMVS